MPKTSVYLPEDLAARVKASGRTLRELIEQALDHPGQAATDGSEHAIAEVRAELATLRAEMTGHHRALSSQLAMHLDSHPLPCSHQREAARMGDYLTSLADDLAATFTEPFTTDAAAGHWNTAGRTARTRIAQMEAAGLLTRLPPATRPGAGSQAGRGPARYRVNDRTEETEPSHG